MANYLDENGLRTLVDRIKDNFVPYTSANKNINIGNHSFTMSSVFTVGNESSVYTQTVPGSIVLKNPISTLSIGTYSLTVNGTTIYWPTVSADPNGKYFALRSDIPSIDTSLSSTSTNAVQNKVINSTISELSYQLAMVRENLFQTVLSEIDYTEDFATLYPIPDTLSDTDGTHRVLFSETQLREVAGNSIAYNQLVQNGNFESLEGYDSVGGSLSVKDNILTFTINTSPVDIASMRVVHKIDVVTNHKYLVLSSFNVPYDTDIRVFMDGRFSVLGKAIANTWTMLVGIYNGVKSNNSGNIYFDCIYQSSYKIGDEIQQRDYQIFDLTLMGLGSVSTVEEAKSELLKRGIDIDQYNPYSEGEIRDTTASGIKVNGYNLFDEETELGTFDTSTGEKEANDSQIRAKNDIEIFPGNTYMMEYDGDTQNVSIWACLLDENKTIINGSLWGKRFSIATNFRLIAGTTIPATSFVVPSNARYLRFYFTIQYGSVYKNDICFHLSTLRTGYAPYKEPKAISFASTELLGAGEAHDTIKFVEGNVVAGQQRYNMVYVSRVKELVVDENTYVEVSGAGGNYERVLIRFDAETITKEIANNVFYNTLTNKYTNANANQTYSHTYDKIIALARVQISSSRYCPAFWIYDSALIGKTVEEIKTTLAGLIIYTGDLEPTETTLATDLTFEEVSAIIEQGGSIETIYETLAPNCTTGFVVKKATEVSK